MILSNFTLLDYGYKDRAYQNCICTFEIVTDFDIAPQLLTANYTPLDSLLPVNGREQLVKGSSTILDNFSSTLNSLIFEKIEELAFSDKIKDIFLPRWPISKDDFKCNLFASTSIFKDPPNFKMGKHLDNQRVVGNAIVNLVDNDSTTLFFDYKDSDNVIFSTSGKKNAGVFFLNTPAALHTIRNNNSNRYMANTSVMIKKW